jgi:hypothetical protein
MENLKEELTKPLYKNSFDGDSYHSYILFENMDKILEEQTIISKKYAELKCKELLEIVAEKAEIQNEYYSTLTGQTKENVGQEFWTDWEKLSINKDSILNAVDLKEFIK